MRSSTSSSLPRTTRRSRPTTPGTCRSDRRGRRCRQYRSRRPRTRRAVDPGRRRAGRHERARAGGRRFRRRATLDRPPIAPLTGRDPLGLDQPAPGFVAPAWALAPAQPVSTAETEHPPEPRGRPHDAAPAGEPERPVEAKASPGDVAEAVPVTLPSCTSRGDAAPDGDVRAQRGRRSRCARRFRAVAAAAGVTRLRRPSTAATKSSPDASATAVACGRRTDGSRRRCSTTRASPKPLTRSGCRCCQRIDIFTDTTAAARSSASNCSRWWSARAPTWSRPINQHVDDLLRTYVAEALEQEIERWREGQR